jgi:hypothetical protein
VWWVALVLAVAAPAAVRADSFDPVRLSIAAPAVARADRSLAVRVTVAADPGALDLRHGPVRARVKLTQGECGPTYAGTSGPALLNRVLSPQPSPGRAYSATVRGTPRVRTYGTYTVCGFLEDDFAEFATVTSEKPLTVSRACTRAAAAYDRHHSAARRRAARRACGSGVTL